MNKIIVVVAMPGAGESVATDYMVKQGYQRLYFGQVTFDELKKRGLSTNEKNERMVREELRKKYGMAAYAILNLPKLKKLVQKGNVVIQSLYSWAEYLTLRKEYKENFTVLCIYAPPKLRYQRLKERTERPLSFKKSRERDYAEIENLDKGGPIAMADYTVVNDGTLEELYKRIDDILKGI